MSAAYPAGPKPGDVPSAPAPQTKLKIELPGAGYGDEQFGGCRSVETVYDFDPQKDQIGEGTYGKVYLGKEKATGDKVALKKIRMDNEKDGFPITAIREIKILSTLDHPNVIRLREIVRSSLHQSNNFKGSIYMVFDFMDHDLTGLQDRHGSFSLPDIKCFMKQLLEGLHYCHNNGVLHRDLKASNLLIDNNGILKLADFGLARTFQDQQDSRLTNRVITLWYRPPELLMGADHYGPEVDMWSVGCIFAELLMGKALFPGKDEADQLDKIFGMLGTPNEDTWPGVSKHDYFKMVPPNKFKSNRLRSYCTEKKVNEHAISLMEQLLTLDPKKRINAQQAFEHTFFWSDPKPTPPHLLKKYDPSHEWTMKKAKRQERQGHGGGHWEHGNDPKRQKFAHGGGQPPHGQQQHGRNYHPGAAGRHQGYGTGQDHTRYPGGGSGRPGPYGGSTRPGPGGIGGHPYPPAHAGGSYPGAHPPPSTSSQPHGPPGSHWGAPPPTAPPPGYSAPGHYHAPGAPGGYPPPHGYQHGGGGYPPPHGKPGAGSYPPRDQKHHGHPPGGSSWQAPAGGRR